MYRCHSALSLSYDVIFLDFMTSRLDLTIYRYSVNTYDAANVPSKISILYLRVFANLLGIRGTWIFHQGWHVF